jgi:hypothetical protein
MSIIVRGLQVLSFARRNVKKILLAVVFLLVGFGLGGAVATSTPKPKTVTIVYYGKHPHIHDHHPVAR